jgi:signal transduction histidine kinase
MNFTKRLPRWASKPRVLRHGPIDSAVPPHVAESLLATLREALSNVARHANATLVDVELAVKEDLLLRVCDNGIGLAEPVSTDGHGLSNMAARARQLGGTFDIERAPTKGTIVCWRVPI